MTTKTSISIAARRGLVAALAGIAMLPGPAAANPPLRFVVAYPPGASLDHMARAFGDQMRATTGAVVIVENKPGANGYLAAQAVAQAPADGTTLLIVGDPFITVNPYLYTDSKFDVNSLAVAGVLGFQSSGLVVRAGSDIRSVKDFLERAKRREMTFSSAGPGSSGHLVMTEFQHEAGLKMLHVPYKGGAPAVLAVMSGEVDAAFLALGNVLPFVQQGKLTLLAVSSPQRLASVPNVPTMVESGFKDLVNRGASLVMVPKTVPAATVAQVTAQVRRVTDSKEFQAAIAKLGIEPAAMDQAQAASWLKAEALRSQRLIATHKIKVE